MSIIEAIILGVIQGLTEFIPVSSSGHLVLAHQALGVSGNDLTFDVALHVGTLFALVIFFYKDLGKYALAILKKTEHSKLAWLLVMATIPAAVLGYLLQSAAESVFRSTRLVVINLIGFGIVMLVAEYIYRSRSKHTKLDKTSRNQALSVGFAQALAVIPGISRSGSTISAGMLMGMERVAATRFSFLLGVPIIAGAALKVLSEPDALAQLSTSNGVFITGMLAAFLSGLFAIRFMLRFLDKHGLEAFAYYRIVFGLVILIQTFFYLG